MCLTPVSYWQAYMGNLHEQWRRFCEHIVTGSIVDGIVLSDYYWYRPGMRGFAVGKTPYLRVGDGLSRRESVRISLRNLVAFWSSMGQII